MRRRARRSTWRNAAAEAGRPRKLPQSVLIGLGLIMPIFLIGAGIWAMGAEEVRLPRFRVSASHVASAPVTDGGGDYLLTGSGADGVGICLIGIAIIIHAHLFTRRLPAVRKLTLPGITAGCMVVAGGVLFVVLGA